MPKRDDKLVRLPLREADVKTVKRNFGQLDKHDQLLFRVLATTGMRLSEAFEIENEQKEGGCRYVIIGKKRAVASPPPTPRRRAGLSAQGDKGTVV